MEIAIKLKIGYGPNTVFSVIDLPISLTLKKTVNNKIAFLIMLMQFYIQPNFCNCLHARQHALKL